MEFWYRQSDEALIPLADAQNVHKSLGLSLRNPPPVVPGMVSVRVNRDDALRELLVINSEQLASGRREVSEERLLKLARVIPEEADAYDQFFERVEPTDAKFEPWSPPVFSQNRFSFIPRRDSNVSSEKSDFSLSADIRRVDVAEVDGQVVFFHVVDDTAPTPRTFEAIEPRNAPFGSSLTLIVTLVAVVLAWRNVLAGRSDLRGARWLAVGMFVIDSAETAFSFFPTPGLLMAGQLLALATSARVWIYYVALEPLARRYWPEMLVTWSRALEGRVQDPGVGRDILYGTVIGIVFTLFAFGLMSFALAPAADPETLCGMRFLLSQLMRGLRYTFGYSMQLGIAMVLVRAVTRNQWLPIVAGTMFVFAWHSGLFSTLLDGPNISEIAIALAYFTYYMVAAVLLARLGVLAACAYLLSHDFFKNYPWNWDGPALAGTLFALIAILVCAGYGFYVAIGGRTAFAGGDKAIA